MSQKMFVKLEKHLACDLKPGDLFVMQTPESFAAELRADDLAVLVMLKTNVPSEDAADGDALVYKLHIDVVDREAPAPPKVYPHAPPGMKDK
jgi:hypothetical protein